MSQYIESQTPTDDSLGIGVHGPRELLGTVSLVEDIVSQGLEVTEVCADNRGLGQRIFWP